jgi:glutathione S-transferase
MTPTITAFAASPDRGRGLARDMRVRWALEEVGQPYQARLVSFAQMREPAHRALNPFGQIPTFEDGDVTLFESGAIVLHIAQTRPGLLPPDPPVAARAVAWLFAALNTVEPVVLELETARFLDSDKPWYVERLPVIEGRIRGRLADLAAALGGGDWLGESFTLADLVMVGVLMRLDTQGVLAEFPTLIAYVARAQARPAYQRAFAAQLAVYQALQQGT